VGLCTNIDFLKRICQSPAFIRGDVETAYIAKYHDELFAEDAVKPESFAQIALALMMQDLAITPGLSRAGPHGEAVGFTLDNERQFIFTQESSVGATARSPVVVTVKQIGRHQFNVGVRAADVEEIYENVLCEGATNSLTVFYPHTRIQSTLIKDGDMLTSFERGMQIRLKLVTPTWFEKALGIKDAANSVVAPMPCKVLSNEVEVGDKVEKGQPLVVIESMKMETVIRSPQNGTVAKLAHKPGDMCKTGTILVLFNDDPS